MSISPITISKRLSLASSRWRTLASTVPAATPRELVNRISADIARAVKSSDLTERMKQQGMEPVGSTPAEFDALIKSEIDKWAKVVKLSGAKVD